MAAYYNDNDPFAAAWLRELIKAGLIADGEVDERSIADVRPDDLRGFVQCHFFAGIGGWSYALRLAGWPDDRPVWTGSCPCQPFSSAGAQAGGADPRDLWPAWVRLIRECRPIVTIGEQVEAAIAHGWYDRLCDDLEGEGYAVGAAGLPACSVGAPHIRQRLWFVADRDRGGRMGRQSGSSSTHQAQYGEPSQYGEVGELAESEGSRCGTGRTGAGGKTSGRTCDQPERPCATGELGDTDDARSQGRERMPERAGECAARPTGMAGVMGNANCTGREARNGIAVRDEARSAEPSHSGFWSDCDWIPCRDGKYRPVEPAPERMAPGLSDYLGRVCIGGRWIYAPLIAKGQARVGRLRGYGNSINVYVAAQFIRAYLDIRP